MTTVAVVQARMSSSRFPGKMLADLRGRPVIDHVLDRVARARTVAHVVLATSDDPSDDALAAHAEAQGYAVHRGSLDDVLARFVGAATATGASVVVRVTGDCPLVDPALVDEMVTRFGRGGLDYLSNVSPPTFPDGFDLEVLSVEALRAADELAASAPHREHVTLYIREHPERFVRGNHVNPRGDLSSVRLSVDWPDDLATVRELLDRLGDDRAGLDAVVAALAADPALKERATGMRNESVVDAYLQDLEARFPRPVITESERLGAATAALIPAGTQTLSKGPTQFVRGFAPQLLARGEGSHVWDVDGNEYVDYPMGLGPVTLGHGHPAVVEAVAAAVAEGTGFSLVHPRELELAERIVAAVPCAEQVRFGKNGSDATSACIRAARAKTGREVIARCGYHGWQDWAIDRSYGIRSRGVPDPVLDLTVPFPYNDLPALEAVLRDHDVAGIIMEPISLVPPEPGYLEGVRALADEYGCVLIFDEVVTGFRYARGGAQEYFGVTPDLCSMGKGVANGMPLSIVTGRREFMEPFEEIFFSFTFGGETASLAAAIATLDVMEREDYWAHAWRMGARLQDSFNALAADFELARSISCGGLPPWTICTFADTPTSTGLELKSLFQQEMIRHRILFSGSQFISLAHTDDDIAATVAAYREAFQVLRFAVDNDAVQAMTLGDPIELVFRRV